MHSVSTEYDNVIVHNHVHGHYLLLGLKISALGKTWNGMDWNGMDWIGMEWNGMEWNGMEFYSIMRS